MVGQDDFFNKLLGETYSLIERESAQPSDIKLSDYFDKKYSKFNTQSLDLFYHQELKVFRLRWQNEWIDFPSNWGIFPLLRESIISGKDSEFVISENDVHLVHELLGLEKTMQIKISISDKRLEACLAEAPQTAARAA